MIAKAFNRNDLHESKRAVRSLRESASSPQVKGLQSDMASEGRPPTGWLITLRNVQSS